MSRRPTNESMPSQGTAEGGRGGENPVWTKAVEATPHGTGRDPDSFAEYSASTTRRRVPDKHEVEAVHHPNAAAAKTRDS